MDLRSSLIRLAHQNPTLRSHPLPLLKTSAFLVLKPGEKEELEALVEPGTGLTYKGISDQKDALPYESKEKRKLFEKRLDKLRAVMIRKQKEKRGLTLSSSPKHLSKMPASGAWGYLGGGDIIVQAIVQGGEPVGWMVTREHTTALRAPGVSYSYGHSRHKSFTAYSQDGKTEVSRKTLATDALDDFFEYLQK